MKVRYSATAITDVDEIATYIEARNPAAAQAVLAAIQGTVERLALVPYSAQETDEPGVRMTPAGRFPYLIFYVVDGDELRVSRVLHGARLRPGEKPRG
jgi:plasmid stabilization system protein ParE